jgi:hypothetical protein
MDRLEDSPMRNSSVGYKPTVLFRKTYRQRRIRPLHPITTGSLTLVTLLLYAIERVKTQAIFDRAPYESRREALPEVEWIFVHLNHCSLLSDQGPVAHIDRSRA